MTTQESIMQAHAKSGKFGGNNKPVNLMQILENEIVINRQIWLSDISGVSSSFIEWLREDCNQTFRYLMTSYNGDHSHGVIDVSMLGEFLADEFFEDDRAEISGYLPEFTLIYEIAKEHKLNEIIFS